MYVPFLYFSVLIFGCQNNYSTAKTSTINVCFNLKGNLNSANCNNGNC